MPTALLLILIAIPGLTAAQSRSQLTWQGYVRAGATLYIHGDHVDIQGRETGSVESPKVKLIKPLPAMAQDVRVKVRRGRGKVEVVEQPVQDNEFTAAVQIHAPSERVELFVID